MLRLKSTAKKGKKQSKKSKLNSQQSRRLGNFRVPDYQPEKALQYAPGSAERVELANECKKIRDSDPVEVPVVIGGKKIFTKSTFQQVMPSNHSKVVANIHLATPEMIQEAIEVSLKAKRDWAALPQFHRNAVFRRAADLIATKHRARMNAVTMMGTGKTVWQAEIDSAQEQVDFLRLNANFCDEIANIQPPLNSDGVWNRMKFRPLEGFVAAFSPFNFCAIGTNLNAAPAIVGNTTLWKPSMNAALENYVSFEILQEAGVPDGVINFVPAEHDDFNRVAFNSKHFAALHFTGSTEVYQNLWKQIGNSVSTYRSYPRLVGETGGKNFHLIHPTADIEHSVLNLVRSAFEYQGQKCSACSRAYIPRSLWNNGFRDQLLETVKTIKQGQPDDFSTFMSAVISRQSATKHQHYIDMAHQSDEAQVIYGGNVDMSQGWFVEPTIILTTNPQFPTMTDELFGPILTIHLYEDHEPHAWDSIMKTIDSTSNYALTGSVFARDRYALDSAEKALENSCGNLYFNDKSTGAVVGQQPFGGTRQSGQCDKPGSHLHLLRFLAPQAIKETSTLLNDYTYPHMKQ